MNTSILASLGFSLGLALPGGAQNFVDDHASPSAPRPAGTGQLPVVHKVPSSPAEGQPVIASQDAATLEPRLSAARRQVDSVVDLAVLREPSPFRQVATGQAANPALLATEGLKQNLSEVSAVYRESGRHATDCASLELAVVQRAKLDAAEVVVLVETEVMANPACACEIVKAAIRGSDADSARVVAIVETAIMAAPETMRMVSQCAIAAMPEALAEVQALLARLDPNAGESATSAKSAKGAKDAKAAAVVNDVAALPNPLDFPGIGPVGPTPGGPGGQPLVPLVPPILTPTVTDVDP